MTKNKCYCGKSTNRNGKPLNEHSLLNHMQQCRVARNIRHEQQRNERLDNSDMPDGAYFALMEELGEL